MTLHNTVSNLAMNLVIVADISIMYAEALRAQGLARLNAQLQEAQQEHERQRRLGLGPAAQHHARELSRAIKPGRHLRRGQ